jgi:hypothetical protein
MSVRPMENAAPISWILMKFGMNIFLKSVKKIQVSLISDKNNGTVRED